MEKNIDNVPSGSVINTCMKNMGAIAGKVKIGMSCWLSRIEPLIAPTAPIILANNKNPSMKYAKDRINKKGLIDKAKTYINPAKPTDSQIAICSSPTDPRP